MFSHFRLCADLDTENSNDVSNFFSVLAGNFENVVQYNKDNREFEVSVIEIGVEHIVRHKCNLCIFSLSRYCNGLVSVFVLASVGNVPP